MIEVTASIKDGTVVQAHESRRQKYIAAAKRMDPKNGNYAHTLRIAKQAEQATDEEWDANLNRALLDGKAEQDRSDEEDLKFKQSVGRSMKKQDEWNAR